MKLKEIREKQKLTQEELARKSGISVYSIARIERTEKCSLKNAKKIATALNVKIDDLC